MNEFRTFSAIREQFEVGLSKNQNVETQSTSDFQTKSTFEVPHTTSVGIIKRQLSTLVTKQEMNSSKQVSPENQQKRLVIKKQFSFKKTEDNGNDFRSTTTSRSAQHVPIVKPQAEPLKGKTFNGLIQQKSLSVKNKPETPKKAETKLVVFQNLELNNLKTSVQHSQTLRPNNQSVDVKCKSANGQTSSSVNNLRKQFEQKDDVTGTNLFDTHITNLFTDTNVFSDDDKFYAESDDVFQREPFYENFLVNSHNAPNVLPKLNEQRKQYEQKDDVTTANLSYARDNSVNSNDDKFYAESDDVFQKAPIYENFLVNSHNAPNVLSKLKELRKQFEQKDHVTRTNVPYTSDESVHPSNWGTLQKLKQRGFFPNEFQTNLVMPHGSRSIPRNTKQVKFSSNATMEQCTPTAEASNFDITNSFNDTNVFSDDDEFDDVFENEPLYENFIVNSDSVPNELPRLPLPTPRQRASYAEPRIRTELKLSKSFNQSDIQVHQETEENAQQKKIKNIIEELINTEDVYLQNLLKGIKNYKGLFTRNDRPRGLNGKEYHLLGNIEQIAAFHQDTLLPMFIKNQNDLNKLIDEFLSLLDNQCMYIYVLYTMNKRRSLELCLKFEPYLTSLRRELGEKLGIDAFLMQPIQRLPRYKGLFQNLIKPLFIGRYDKDTIASCCRLEKKIDNLLQTANEADLLYDIVGWNDFTNTENKFRKVVELSVYDERKLCYGSKVFIFDKCMIYTEILGKDLIFRGYYDARKEINLTLQNNSFTLSYLHPKRQECIFHGKPSRIQCCLELMDDMIQRYRKRTPNETSHMQNQTTVP